MTVFLLIRPQLSSKAMLTSGRKCGLHSGLEGLLGLSEASSKALTRVSPKFPCTAFPFLISNGSALHVNLCTGLPYSHATHPLLDSLLHLPHDAVVFLVADDICDPRCRRVREGRLSLLGSRPR